MLKFLSQFKFYWSGKYPQRYKIFDLNLSQNQTLKTKLFTDGVFDFYSLNKGNLISYHQIIAFYFSGGIDALKRGLVCPSSLYEVHHIDGNTLNNTSSNLVIIPKCLHLEISKGQRRICKYIKLFSKQSANSLSHNLNQVTVFNSQGRIIYNTTLFAISLLLKSLVKTFYSLSNQAIQLDFKNIKSWWLKTSKSFLNSVSINWHNSLILQLV